MICEKMQKQNSEWKTGATGSYEEEWTKGEGPYYRRLMLTYLKPKSAFNSTGKYVVKLAWGYGNPITRREFKTEKIAWKQVEKLKKKYAKTEWKW